MNRSRRTADDLQHLRLLSIFHYVVGGLAVLCGFFPFIHLAVGVGMITGNLGGPPKPGAAPPPPALGWLFVGFASAAILFAWAFAVGMFVAGNFLRTHRGYVFCLVMAGLACLFQPHGTILGVFTIIVLLRPSVKRLFGRTPDGSADPDLADA